MDPISRLNPPRIIYQIDYPHIHNASINLFNYIKYFISDNSQSEQILEEIKNTMSNVVFTHRNRWIKKLQELKEPEVNKHVV